MNDIITKHERALIDEAIARGAVKRVPAGKYALDANADIGWRDQAKKGRRRLREKRVARILHLAPTHTITQICEDTGLAETTVRNTLRENGIDRPSDLTARMIALARTHTSKEIAAETMMSLNAVRARLARAGVRPRPAAHRQRDGEKARAIRKCLADGMSPREVATEVGCECSYVYHVRATS